MRRRDAYRTYAGEWDCLEQWVRLGDQEHGDESDDLTVELGNEGSSAWIADALPPMWCVALGVGRRGKDTRPSLVVHTIGLLPEHTYGWQIGGGSLTDDHGHD